MHGKQRREPLPIHSARGRSKAHRQRTHLEASRSAHRVGGWAGGKQRSASRAPGFRSTVCWVLWRPAHGGGRSLQSRINAAMLAPGATEPNASHSMDSAIPRSDGRSVRPRLSAIATASFRESQAAADASAASLSAAQAATTAAVGPTKVQGTPLMAHAGEIRKTDPPRRPAGH